MRVVEDSRPSPEELAGVDDRPAWRPVADHWLLSLGLAALSAALIRFRAGVDADAWLHLRIGRELRSGDWFQSLPDPLVVLADRAYLPTQWLSEVVGSLVFETGGVVGLRVLRAVALLGLFAVLYATARRSMSPARSTGVVAVAAFASSAAWAERPQMAGLALAGVTVLLWTATVHDGRPRWALVPVTWVWAMLHGTWALGLAFGGAAVVATLVARRRAAQWPAVIACLALCTAVVSFTPLGPRLLVEPFAVTASARPGVNEWQPPTFDNPVYILVLVVAAAVLVRVFRRRPADLAAAVFAVSAAGLAAYSVRTIAFGALLLVPALARSFPSSPRPAETRRELVPLVVSGVLLCLAPGVVWGGPSSGPLSPGLDSALDAVPAGQPVAIDIGVSGWVLHAHPGIRPMRDLRAEVYTPTTAEAYETFSKGRSGWQAYAAAHDITLALVSRDDALDRGMAADPSWTEVAADGEHRLWQRR